MHLSFLQLMYADAVDQAESMQHEISQQPSRFLSSEGEKDSFASESISQEMITNSAWNLGIRTDILVKEKFLFSNIVFFICGTLQALSPSHKK